MLIFFLGMGSFFMGGPSRLQKPPPSLPPLCPKSTNQKRKPLSAVFSWEWGRVDACLEKRTVILAPNQLPRSPQGSSGGSTQPTSQRGFGLLGSVWTWTSFLISLNYSFFIVKWEPRALVWALNGINECEVSVLSAQHKEGTPLLHIQWSWW